MANEYDVDALAKKYGGGPAASSGDIDIDALADKYSNLPTSRTSSPVEGALGGATGMLGGSNTVMGVKKGVEDVVNTSAKAIGYGVLGVERLFKTNIGGKEKLENLETRIKTENKDFEAQYGGTVGGELGRVGGQIAATAPLIPARVFQGVRMAVGAMPYVTATGEKIAAPLLKRGLAGAIEGTVAGGTFGALTSEGSDRSLGANVGINALGGFVGGPIIEAAGSAASKIAPAIKSGIANARINWAAGKYGITRNSARDVLKILDDEGISLAEAESTLIKLGDKATLADLSPGLQTLAGALVQRGGRTTAILKNRYANRAEMADDVATQIMETKLGPKPDLEAIGKSIKDEAFTVTKPDYEAAKINGGITLDVRNIIANIDDNLSSAVGSKKSQLAAIKSYFYRDIKNPVTGETEKVLKNNVKDLHEVRIGLDDAIERLGSPTGSQGSKTLGAVTNVRKSLDKILKTVPEMKAADEKFAERMGVMKGLEIGQEALKKGSYQNFEKVFKAASPELQDTIRQGLHTAIRDMMENAAKGELSGAQQLFKSRTATREKLKIAFGAAGDEVLDALATQATMRATENMVATGARTAINLRINALYDNQHPSGAIMNAGKEFVKGLAVDVSTGATMPAATILAAKQGGADIMKKIGEKRFDYNVESTADLLSRTGKDLTDALKVVSRVSRIENKLKKEPFQIRLPVAAAGPTGSAIEQYGYDKYNK